MGNYSIKDLEKLSGIKAHTIRIWEQRYNLLTPERTETNIRTYGDAELKKILNVSLLVGGGYKISHLSKLSDSELNNELQQIYGSVKEKLVDTAVNIKINSLIVAMIDLNEELFDQVFSTSVLKRGFFDTITQVVYPFLAKVGIMWTVNEINPSQEHFISALIRQKVLVAIDGLMKPAKTAEKYLLFLPENELHELGLLFAHYLLKSSGKQVIYLGQNVPQMDVETVLRIAAPEKCLTFFTTPMEPEAITEYFNSMVYKFPETEFLLSGSVYLLEKVKLPPKVVRLENIKDFLRLLDK